MGRKPREPQRTLPAVTEVAACRRAARVSGGCLLSYVPPPAAQHPHPHPVVRKVDEDEFCDDSIVLFVGKVRCFFYTYV